MQPGTSLGGFWVFPGYDLHPGQYGADVALQALTEAGARGRTVRADAAILAARLAPGGPARPADPGPDWAAYATWLTRGVQ
jgi:hypothetical protein